MIRALPGRVEFDYLPLPLADILAQVEASVQRAELGLAHGLSHSDATAARGKGVQSLLLLLSAECAGGAGARSVSLATVVETIHAAARAHDGVSDDGFIPDHMNQTSILLGDYLFAAAFGALAANGNNAFMSELMDVVARMCEGQVRFLRARGRFLSTPEYLDLLRRKAGSLAGFCARAGGQTAGGSAELSEALGAFGERFGVAFHLAGEVLDITEGDGSAIARVLGPERGFTLPLVLTSQAGPDERAALVAIAGKTEFSSDDLKEVRRIAEASGAINQCRELVDGWLQEALEQLAPLPETEAKRLLVRIAVDLCAAAEVNRFGS